VLRWSPVWIATSRTASSASPRLKPLEKSHNHKAGVGIVIAGHSYLVEVVEQTNRVELTAEEVERWTRRHPYWPVPSHRRVANGKLRLATAAGWDSGRRSNFNEGARGPLEDRLPAFLAELEQRAVLDGERQRDWKRRDAERQRQLAEQRTQARRLEIERARAARLRTEIAAWQLGQEADTYIAALRGRLNELPDQARERASAWCDWAEGWARDSDPVRSPHRIRGLIELD
jgi:hypothetical protein